MRKAALIVLVLGGCEKWLDVPRGDPNLSGDVTFEEATASLGYGHVGPTYGMGWGDPNGDGLPDLWQGSHALSPVLHVNRGDGTFAVETDLWLEADFPRSYDDHGVLWIDLDGDGREDLVESVGAQQGEGLGRSRVHLNLNGRFRDVGRTHALGHDLASGRCPVPLDWNGDGLSDVVMVAQPRVDGTKPTALFTQQADHSYVLQAEATTEALPTALCGQLADLNGDDRPELLAYARPANLVAYDLSGGTFEDVSRSVGIPASPTYPFDVIVGDFDNDLDNDLYVTRWLESSHARVQEAQGYAGLALRLKEASSGIAFRTTGEVRISLDPPGFWSPDDFKLGADCTRTVIAPDALGVIVTAQTREIQGRCPMTPGADTGMFIGVEDGRFYVNLATVPFNRGNVVVQSAEPLTDVELLNVETLTEEQETTFYRDRLYMQNADGWKDEGWARGIQQLTTCTSAVSGDFDNDMDLDLFLVCATPVENTADLLYLNDGRGVFTLAARHGAEGTGLGRGDSVSVADYDQDGFLDLLVTNGYGAAPFNYGPVQLFHNSGNEHHWLEIDLVGTRDTREAWGAKVIVRTPGTTQMREVSGGTHATAQNHRRLHVGLWTWDEADVEVRWPDGSVQTIDGVSADQVLRIEQE